MTRAAGRLVCLAAAVAMAAGCSSSEGKAKHHLSGKVTFKGRPVPAGYISFLPESGAVTMAQIKDGVYDTAKEADSGISPGVNKITISGFDGKPLEGFPQGKQIFNPYEEKHTLSEGTAKLDFDVPAFAAENLKIVPTEGAGGTGP